MKDTEKATELLLRTIVEALEDVKGEEIVALDLRPLEDTVSDYFVICHGNSTTQVGALAERVIKECKDKIGERPLHKEGFTNNEWICIDYVDIVVHVFLRDRRTFYQLEELWSDAEQIDYSVSTTEDK